MPTRNELIFQFMISLASNASVQVGDANYVFKLASNLADKYLKHQGQLSGESGCYEVVFAKALVQGIRLVIAIRLVTNKRRRSEYPTHKGIIMKKVIIVMSVLGLTACGSTPPAHVPMHLNAPNVTLHYDAQVQQMSRQEVIQATMDCESAGMRASPIMTKRRVSGMLSDIIIDIQCIPRYRVF